MIKKGSWVQIHKILLAPDERPDTLPEDTRKVPLEMWVKGWLLEDARMDDSVKVMTVTGRIETGNLVQVNPAYLHTYGNFVPEILQIDRILKSDLFGSDDNE